jgi:uroporphyrinogen-III synthase
MVIEAPLLLEVVPAAKDALLRAATRRCVSAPLDYLVVTSAEGWTQWLDAAAHWRLDAVLLDVLRETRIVATTPSVAAALRRSGLSPARTPPSAGLADAVAWLVRQDLVQRRIALARHEAAPDRLLVSLKRRGADVIDVPTLRLAPPGGRAPLHGLARMVIQRRVHAVTFVSTLVTAALADLADRTGLRPHLIGACANDVVLATAAPEIAGPFVERSIPAQWVDPVEGGRPADDIPAYDIPADDIPAGEHGVAELVAAALIRRRREFTAGSTRFAVQGSAVLLDTATLLLQPGPAAIMRALADRPGMTVSRTALERLSLLPGGPRSYALDVAVGHLRAALGDYRWLVSTVVGRGYRLAVDSVTADSATAGQSTVDEPLR